MQSQYLGLYGAVPERFGQSAKRLAALLVPEGQKHMRTTFESPGSLSDTHL
jgi:hypothetical protein